MENILTNNKSLLLHVVDGIKQAVAVADMQIHVQPAFEHKGGGYYQFIPTPHNKK